MINLIQETKTTIVFIYWLLEVEGTCILIIIKIVYQLGIIGHKQQETTSSILQREIYGCLLSFQIINENLKNKV